MICIIDYGSGNLSAIEEVCRRENIAYFISSDAGSLQHATHFIVPGVGAFDSTMRCLRDRKITLALLEQVQTKNKPLLGICVGMHILAPRSEEGSTEGLNLISGRVKKVTSSNPSGTFRLPHMGWNSISRAINDPLLDGIDCGVGFYFLHSYYFVAENAANIVATSNYGADLPCIIRRGNIVGVQFHPEKSHSNGRRFIRNFAGVI